MNEPNYNSFTSVIQKITRLKKEENKMIDWNLPKLLSIIIAIY
jgi:hypothetical protein